MLYKALIEQVIDPYRAKVRIPMIHRTELSSDFTSTEDLPIACIATLSGCQSLMEPGDVVIVSFENNDLSRPLILGHLSCERNIYSKSSINASSLYVSSSSSLSKQTSIGDIRYSDLENLKGCSGNLQKQIDLINEAIAKINNRLDNALS